jgi:hypothetical protein
VGYPLREISLTDKPAHPRARITRLWSVDESWQFEQAVELPAWGSGGFVAR